MDLGEGSTALRSWSIISSTNSAIWLCFSQSTAIPQSRLTRITFQRKYKIVAKKYIFFSKMKIQKIYQVGFFSFICKKVLASKHWRWLQVSGLQGTFILILPRGQRTETLMEVVATSMSLSFNFSMICKKIVTKFLLHYFSQLSPISYLWYLCNGRDEGPALVYLILLSVIVQIRSSTSVWNSPFNHPCSQIKRLTSLRVKLFIGLVNLRNI